MGVDLHMLQEIIPTPPQAQDVCPTVLIPKLCQGLPEQEILLRFPALVSLGTISSAEARIKQKQLHTRVGKQGSLLPRFMWAAVLQREATGTTRAQSAAWNAETS